MIKHIEIQPNRLIPSLRKKEEQLFSYEIFQIYGNILLKIIAINNFLKKNSSNKKILFITNLSSRKIIKDVFKENGFNADLLFLKNRTRLLDIIARKIKRNVVKVFIVQK